MSAPLILHGFAAIRSSSTDSGFKESKNRADEHLKRSGLTPCWSVDDLNRERAIKWADYCAAIYESRVANV